MSDTLKIGANSNVNTFGPYTIDANSTQHVIKTFTLVSPIPSGALTLGNTVLNTLTATYNDGATTTCTSSTVVTSKPTPPTANDAITIEKFPSVVTAKASSIGYNFIVTNHTANPITITALTDVVTVNIGGTNYSSTPQSIPLFTLAGHTSKHIVQNILLNGAIVPKNMVAGSKVTNTVTLEYTGGTVYGISETIAEKKCWNTGCGSTTIAGTTFDYSTMTPNGDNADRDAIISPVGNGAFALYNTTATRIRGKGAIDLRGAMSTGNVGDYSLATGTDNTSDGTNSLVIGTTNDNTGNNNILGGISNSLSGNNNLMIGDNSPNTITVSASNSMIGGQNHVAINATNSVISGSSQNLGATVSNSVIVGTNNITSGNITSLIMGGFTNTATADKNILTGDYNVAYTTGNIFGGSTNTANIGSSNSLLIGDHNTIATPGNIVGGSANTANVGNGNNLIIGNNNAANTGSSGSIIGGNNNASSGGYNTVSGTYNSVNGTNNLVVGDNSTAKKTFTGSNNVIAGLNHVALTTNNNSLLVGNLNNIVGTTSSLIGGTGNITTGTSSGLIMGGNINTATANYNILTGDHNTANTTGNILGGSTNTADTGSGNSLVVGTSNISRGTGNIIGGLNNIMKGSNNLVVGDNTGAGVPFEMTGNNNIIAGLNHKLTKCERNVVTGSASALDCSLGTSIANNFISGETITITTSASSSANNNLILGSNNTVGFSDSNQNALYNLVAGSNITFSNDVQNSIFSGSNVDAVYCYGVRCFGQNIKVGSNFGQNSKKLTNCLVIGEGGRVVPDGLTGSGSIIGRDSLQLMSNNIALADISPDPTVGPGPKAMLGVTDIGGIAKLALGTAVTVGNDYAEYFELETVIAEDDRIGYFVEFGDTPGKVRISTKNVIGVFGSADGTASIIGDTAELEWNNALMRDKFGRTMREKTYRIRMRDRYPDIKLPDKTDGVELLDYMRKLYPDDTFSEDDFDYQAVMNPDYDPSKGYISRSLRPEWAVVGLLGKVIVRDNGKCTPGEYCSNLNGIAAPVTKNVLIGDTVEVKRKWYVLNRVSEDTVRILFN